MPVLDRTLRDIAGIQLLLWQNNIRAISYDITAILQNYGNIAILLSKTTNKRDLTVVSMMRYCVVVLL